MSLSFWRLQWIQSADVTDAYGGQKPPTPFRALFGMLFLSPFARTKDVVCLG